MSGRGSVSLVCWRLLKPDTTLAIPWGGIQPAIPFIKPTPSQPGLHPLGQVVTMEKSGQNVKKNVSTDQGWPLMFNSSRKKKDLASPCRRSHTDGSHGDGGTSPPPPVLKSSANASVHPVRSSPSEGRWRLRFGIHLVHERGMQSGSHGWQACPRGLRTNEGKGGHLQCQGKGRMWDVVQVE